MATPKTPAPKKGGGEQWWVEYIVGAAVPGQPGTGGEATPQFVESATEPKPPGDGSWVTGPYPTKLAAQTAANNGTPPGKGPGFHLPSVGGAVKDAIGGLFPQFQHTRGLAVRVAQVVIGVILIITGLVQISHVSKLVPEAAKGLAIAA